MPIGPTIPIPAPPLRQPTTGLVAVAPAANTPDGWTGEPLGIDPETCDVAVTLPQDCGSTPEKDLPEKPDPVLIDPVVIIGGDPCISTMGRIPAESEARATRHLQATTSAALEQVAWTGEATSDDTAEGVNRPHFASADTEVLAAGGPVSPVHGLALVDQALTTCLSNGQGMIHVTPYTLTRLVGAQLLIRENGRWLSPAGHLVIAGAGYTGGGPRPAAGDPLPAPPDLLATAPADQWIYGTAMVQVALGPVRDDSPPIHIASNTVMTLRERAAAAFWGCCSTAALLDLTES